MRRSVGSLFTLSLLAALLVAAPAQSAPGDRLPQGESGLEVYVGRLAPRQLDTLVEVGVDRADVVAGRATRQGIPVEVILTADQAKALRAAGVDLAVKQINGTPASRVAARQAANGHRVYRSYSEPGGIRDELISTTRRYQALTELVALGSTVRGREILGVRVTRDASSVPDGDRPAVLFTGGQHAREWITPEMVRRLMHHVLERYGESQRITRLVETTEMWFVPVANPDGYDFTFTQGNRLWRKNLRDNNRDGQITPGDGVDLNRNYPFKWGWDNEGSSPDPANETYRGTAPASEPETRALLRLADRVGFEYHINYHSAAELLLYGTGWQVSTPTPDDAIFETLAGTDDTSAIPGYDPDLSAELYTTNGETTEHMHEAYGTLGFTPEMTTCETVSAADPNDQWEPDECVSVFNFPDDPQLIRAEFRKNIPFALSVAASTRDPDDPKSVVGREAPAFVEDPFRVSYGSPQPVAVTAKRALDDLALHYRINGGATVNTSVSEWPGGERYGDFNEVYYAEYRGEVLGATAGDSVQVWFSGHDPDAGEDVVSRRFTYTVHDDTGGDALVLAAEDVTGDAPLEPGRNARYVDVYQRALSRAGYTSDVYDVDARGRSAPHHLGVLDHYDAVVWETGDDIIPREVGQPAGTAAELALDLELTVRDYVNERGKLLLTGKWAEYAQATDGIYYYNPFEEQQGECTTYGEYPCLPLLNDFLQYWLGAYVYVDGGGQDRDGQPFPLEGVAGAFDGFTSTLNGGTSADNQDHTAAFLTTSSFLPPDEFPQFTSSAPVDWARPGAAPFDPFTGDWYVYSDQADVSYKRFSRTIDLRDANRARLSFRTSYDAETDWDYLFVEAHTVGRNNWTTLPDERGHTSRSTGASCPEGWVEQLHPFLAHYQNPKCEPHGTTGRWHAATGSSGGWQRWSVDLADYAGQRVEVSISYVSDWSFQGIGVFLDNTRVVVGGSSVADTSFERGLGGWTVPGPPRGSQPNPNDWHRTRTAFEEGAGVATDDTVYVGFGAEGLRSVEKRTDFLRRAMAHLLN